LIALEDTWFSAKLDDQLVMSVLAQDLHLGDAVRDYELVCFLLVMMSDSDDAITNIGDDALGQYYHTSSIEPKTLT